MLFNRINEVAGTDNIQNSKLQCFYCECLLLDTGDKIGNSAGTVTAFRELTEQQRQQALSR